MGQIFSGATAPSYSFKLDFDHTKPVDSSGKIDVASLLERTQTALNEIQNYKVRIGCYLRSQPCFSEIYTETGATFVVAAPSLTATLCHSPSCSVSTSPARNIDSLGITLVLSPSLPQSCQDAIKKAIEAPKDAQINTDAAVALKDNILAIKSWYDLAEDMAAVLPQIAATISEKGAITEDPELTVALGQLVAFMYRFDQAKLYESGIQNDFSG